MASRTPTLHGLPRIMHASKWCAFQGGCSLPLLPPSPPQSAIGTLAGSVLVRCWVWVWHGASHLHLGDPWRVFESCFGGQISGCCVEGQTLARFWDLLHWSILAPAFLVDPHPPRNSQGQWACPLSPVF